MACDACKRQSALRRIARPSFSFLARQEPARNWSPAPCTSIPQDLLESELFGHVKGSFTGAANDRAGAFREAGNGTLFLDEIGDMPLAMQSKILRALQDQTITPVGG